MGGSILLSEGSRLLGAWPRRLRDCSEKWKNAYRIWGAGLRNVRCLARMLGVWHPMLGDWHSILGVWHRMLGVWLCCWGSSHFMAPHLHLLTCRHCLHESPTSSMPPELRRIVRLEALQQLKKEGKRQCESCMCRHRSKREDGSLRSTCGNSPTVFSTDSEEPT